jgi:hypothetical protein
MTTENLSEKLSALEVDINATNVYFNDVINEKNDTEATITALDTKILILFEKIEKVQNLLNQDCDCDEKVFAKRTKRNKRLNGYLNTCNQLKNQQLDIFANIIAEYAEIKHYLNSLLRKHKRLTKKIA